MQLASLMNTIWGVLVIVAQLFSIVLIVSFFSEKVRSIPVIAFFKNNPVLVAFIVSVLSTAGSLIYSDIIGYQPCKLCWFQRIFMYPQVLLMGMALWRKDSAIKIYGFVMSVIGAAIALFHYTGQLGLTPLPCSAVGISVSCSERFVMEFGYITIPMMAFAAFTLMSLAFALALWKGNEQAPQ